MGGWTHTARAERCGGCGALAVLLARTQRCELCEADAYDAMMQQEFPQWYVPYGPKPRALAAAESGASPCA
jgi:hypothetical protein